MIELANLTLFLIALGFSSVASYFDLKTGEIPDKFTLGLVVVALAIRALFAPSLGWEYLLDGALVGAILFGFGALLFYTGGWGGGDAKLISGIGAALGGLIAPSIIDAGLGLFPPFFGIFIALSIVAIPYSLGYALILAARKPEVFSLIRKRICKNWMIFAMAAAASMAAFIIFPLRSPLSLIISAFPVLFYFIIIFSRSVEETAMQKEVGKKELREGDMVAEDIIIKGKKIASKRDMDGLSKEALATILQAKEIKNVRIKWGIRFAPAFPLALLICPFWASLVLAFI
jgi:Flp pilus assembly protein protease CpaA